MMRKEEVRKIEALKKELDSLNNEITTINNFKENRPMTLNILKELTSILPKTAWLTRARITESTVEIEGYASSASMLLPKLEASNYFKKAEFASPTFRDARMNADRFNIKMEIEGIKKDEGEVPKNEKK
jgi:general secretion pathway protein L